MFEGKYKHRTNHDGKRLTLVLMASFLAANEGAEKKKFEQWLEVMIKFFIEKEDRYVRLGLASVVVC